MRSASSYFMLSKALQRNAKNEARFSNTSLHFYMPTRSMNHQEFFASLGMTVNTKV